MADPGHSSPSPAFLVTIDAEGDNVWSRPRVVSVRNAAFLPRFHALCSLHGLRPTYLTTYEMARSPAFAEFARHVVATGTGEIGAHPHAWSTPPLAPLTEDDATCHPYMVEYPEPVIREKLATLTGLLGDTIGVEAVSHRAGRWAFDARYARLLVERGYLVDCSVTPHVSWRLTMGLPSGRGGTDYTGFPDCAYFVDLADISKPGGSPLLEVPVTVVPSPRPPARWVHRVADALPAIGPMAACRRAIDRLVPRVWWLRPNGRNRKGLLGVLERARADGRGHVEFMLHSSELMPGGSPRFPDARAIEALYDTLSALFEAARGRFCGLSLAQYRRTLARPAAARDEPRP